MKPWLMEISHSMRKRRFSSAFFHIHPIPATIIWAKPVPKVKTDITIEATQFLDNLFGIDVETAIYVMMSKCAHGEDRKGLFCVDPNDAFRLKRPQRRRLSGELLEMQQRYVLNPDECAYKIDNIDLLYECAVCGFCGTEDKWPWSSTAGFASSDYISACPGCGLKQGDLLERLVEGKTFRINKRYSHDRPMVFPASYDFKYAICCYGGKLATDQKNYFVGQESS